MLQAAEATNSAISLSPSEVTGIAALAALAFSLFFTLTYVIYKGSREDLREERALRREETQTVRAALDALRSERRG